MKYLAHHICTLLLLLSLIGCGRGEQYEIESGTQLQVVIDQSHPLRTTEAGVDALNENRLTSMALAFYEGERQVWLPDLSSYRGETTITFETSAIPLTDGVSYTVYAFANLPSTIDLRGKTLTQLKALSLTLPQLASETLQSSFTMVGAHTFTYTTSMASMGTVKLKRHLAKLRLTAYWGTHMMSQREQLLPKDAQGEVIEDGFWGVPQYMLDTFNTQGLLLPSTGTATPTSLSSMADYTTLDKKVTHPQYGDGRTHTAGHYTYPFAWKSNSDETPKFRLRIPFYHGTTANPDHSEATYYYYVGDYSNTSLPGGDQIYGNWLYDILLNIDALGSTSPATPLPLTPQFTIRQWSEKIVEAEVTDTHKYLHLNPMQVDMYGNQLEINFSSSLPLSTTNLSIKGDYTIYDKNNGDTKVYQLTNVGTLSVSGQNVGKIILNKPLPTIYTAHRLQLTVAVDGMTRVVEITQYPDIIVDVEKSMKPGNNGNPNMYIFKLTKSDGTGYMVGYPDTHHPVDSDDEIVSPHFQVATWNAGKTGGTDPKIWNYGDAKAYCQNLTDIDSRGRTLDDWRLPSRRELEIMSRVTGQSGGVTEGQDILDNGNSNLYWSISDNAQAGRTRVRCVRDIK